MLYTVLERILNCLHEKKVNVREICRREYDREKNSLQTDIFMNNVQIFQKNQCKKLVDSYSNRIVEVIKQKCGSTRY